MRLWFALFLAWVSFSYGSPTADEKLSTQIRLSSEDKGYIGYLKLSKDTPIQESTYLYVKFALEEFKKKKVPFVVLDIDSPGGEVFAALKISQELKKLDSQDHIPVIAFVDNWALSAGALIAYSCRFIAITPDASMGAAEPVIASSEGKMESASEKMNSALRAEFANTARYFGRDPLIAEAMVDKDIILVKRKGRILRLENESDILSSGSSKDIVISRKGKLLTLDAKLMLELNVADFEVPYTNLSPITEAQKEKGQWLFSQNLLSQQTYLQKAKDYTLVGYANRKIDFFAFLAHPLISSLLMMGLVVGIYAEISHPGTVFFGVLACFCLSLIFISNFAMATIAWLEVIAMVAGMILIAVELLFSLSMGVLAVLGGVIFLLGLISLMLPSFSGALFSTDVQSWNWVATAIVDRFVWLMGALLLSLVAMALLSKFLTGRRAIKNKIVLQSEMDRESGYVSSCLDRDLPSPGSEGVAATTLRPSGKVLIHGTLFEALAQEFFIEKGEMVVVVEPHEGKVRVKRKV
ncbi:MAG: hypothetical protein EBZ47_05665 [Chlamydiae bacterium]|nr:hypothetical protein [Chlamydiota bacterium]